MLAAQCEDYTTDLKGNFYLMGHDAVLHKVNLPKDLIKEIKTYIKLVHNQSEIGFYKMDYKKDGTYIKYRTFHYQYVVNFLKYWADQFYADNKFIEE